jgi:hypothetical protein
MVATKNSTAKTAKTTKTATKAAEGKAPEKENTQAQAADAAQDTNQVNDSADAKDSTEVKENTESKDTAGSEQAAPADNGGDNDDTQHPQAQSENQADPDAPKEAEEVKRIAVKAMTPRFRRAGFEFSPREQIIDVRKLTEEQLQAIMEEPRLAVRPVGQED